MGFQWKDQGNGVTLALSLKFSAVVKIEIMCALPESAPTFGVRLRCIHFG